MEGDPHDTQMVQALYPNRISLTLRKCQNEMVCTMRAPMANEGLLIAKRASTNRHQTKHLEANEHGTWRAHGSLRTRGSQGPSQEVMPTWVLTGP